MIPTGALSRCPLAAGFGRNSFKTPIAANMDFRVLKYFPFGERVKLYGGHASPRATRLWFRGRRQRKVKAYFKMMPRLSGFSAAQTQRVSDNGHRAKAHRRRGDHRAQQ